MKIVEGKYYRTRDGRKAGPVIPNPDRAQDKEWVFGIADWPRQSSWKVNGTHRGIN